ncbi:AN1-type zinc finger domain-containing protein [Halospeciosus flavus]|uniref:AN1-type zinc finger domain-containing protein n=1 Tax=Halospeciosus flavus TaxID=3032283 RepID=A0ABD5YVZ9_9EURY
MPRCSECRAQTDMPYQCRHCGDEFCSDHRLPDDHSCSTAESDTLGIFDDGDENGTSLEFADDEDGVFSSITDIHGSINIILLFIFSIITARLLAVLFPSVPSGGLSTAPGAKVSVYGSRSISRVPIWC